MELMEVSKLYWELNKQFDDFKINHWWCSMITLIENHKTFLQANNWNTEKLLNDLNEIMGLDETMPKFLEIYKRL